MKNAILLNGRTGQNHIGGTKMQLHLTSENADAIVQLYNTAITNLDMFLKQLKDIKTEFFTEFKAFVGGLRWYKKGIYSGAFCFGTYEYERALIEMRATLHKILICCSKDIFPIVIDDDSVNTVFEFGTITSAVANVMLTDKYGIIFDALAAIKAKTFDINHPIFPTFFRR